MTVQDRIPERLGPYQLVARLGEGGMGVVYLGRDAVHGTVAVKALRSAVAADPTVRRRLAREVDAMRRVHSPHVAEVIDADVTGTPPYIVTRHVPGRTLDDVVTQSGPLTGPALARLASGLAAALTAVHAAGVVHRDLKPGNVMLVNGQPVVIDFGIAQVPESTRITLTGMFMGTPGYLPPEVIEGKHGGPAADAHSFGATVAFAATGRPPFGTGSFETIFYRIMQGQPDLAGVPAPLAGLLTRTLARDPDRRPAAAELAAMTAALDPAALYPAALDAAALAPAAGQPAARRRRFRAARIAASPGAASRAGGASRTVADLPVAPKPPVPRPAIEAASFGDLLPPVSYQPDGAPDSGAAGGGAAGGGAAGGGAAGGGAAIGAVTIGAAGSPAGQLWGATSGSAPPAAADGGASSGAAPATGAPATASFGAARPDAVRRAASRWSPLVVGVIALLVAVSVLLPLAGTAASVAALIALRAADSTGAKLARRRARQGGRLTGFAVGFGYFPVALVRAAVRFVLLAPLALVSAGLAAVVAIIAVPLHPLPRAVACGAGALVACYGLGPGSGGCRQAIAGLFGAASRGAARRVTVNFVVIALAVAAATVAVTGQPAYWPAGHLSFQLAHMPGLHAVIADIRLTVRKLGAVIGW